MKDKEEPKGSFFVGIAVMENGRQGRTGRIDKSAIIS